MNDSVTLWSEYTANTAIYNKYLSYGIISYQDFISPIPPWKSFGVTRLPHSVAYVYTSGLYLKLF